MFQDQLRAENQKREAEAKRHRIEKQEELDMLERTRRELLEDTKIRGEMRLEGRRELEKSWLDWVNQKHKRDAEQTELDRDPGQLLHEQCDKYERCRQCQRRKENVGKTNILKETRYIAGSRLIV